MWWCYSEVPSKVQLHAARVQKDGIAAPSTLDAPGRTQPTPSASRSVGAELAGIETSALGTWCSNRLSGQCPNWHLLQRYDTNCHSPKLFGKFLQLVRKPILKPRAASTRRGLNTPPSGWYEFYSSLPSKQYAQNHATPVGVAGFKPPPILPAPGRTQPTPSASRSVGAEIAGAAT